ncbi:hypothetical protein GCM10010191_34030 [Actinomadura vinacea]|uniref:PE domain-containing protein n=1 Tax=Actinomadura vinacea TaxID=115336 RepID=A0ABN3J1U0_9ACTN
MSEVEVVRSALRQAAKNLDRTLQSFEGLGSPDDLRARAAITAQHLGDWDAGRTLAITTDQAARYLGGSYREFLDEYRAAISALLKVADTYGEAEELTAKRVRDVMSGTDEG